MKALDKASREDGGGLLYKYSTGGSLSILHGLGVLPVRNYTTSIYPEHDKVNGQYIKTHFEHRPSPCWACRLAHSKIMKVSEGPYKGGGGRTRV